MSKLSVIIPTLNEEGNPFYFQILNSFSSFDDVELIVSDGGSSDNTLEFSKNFQAKILSNVTTSRAARINFGLKEASSEMILLHHPRTQICQEGIRYLLENGPKLNWGGFLHSFDMNHPLLRFTSWYSNNIRGSFSGILYLDHCIFLKKDMALAIGDLPTVDIFEDTILSRKLCKKFGKPSLLPYRAQTSAIRFKTNGMVKQSMMNQYLKIKYYLGANHKDMNNFYEKDISLNSNYERKSKKLEF